MKKAISLIELVFAIVIMGISVMSLPMILTQTQEASNLSLRQEAILSVKTKLAYLLAYHWDENTYDATADTERVLNTAGGNAAFNAVGTTLRRVGHIATDGRRRFWDNATNASAVLSTEVGDVDADDMDDFNNFIRFPPETKNINAVDDFIFNLTLTPTINYIPDNPTVGTYAGNIVRFNFNTGNISANSTNIKMIQVTATAPAASGMNAPITMFAFSSNIGQSKILRRAW